MLTLMSSILRCTGIKRILVLLLLGAILTLTLPPFFVTPLLVVSFVGLLLCVEKSRSVGASFWVGWWFGFGHFVSGLYWISYALLIDAEQYAWLIPFAVSLIPAILALFTGAVCAILKWLIQRDVMLRQQRWRLAISFAVLWCFAEIIRSYLFTGFPWNLIGYTWAVHPITLQSAYFVSIFGLSFLAVAVGSIAIVMVEWDGEALRVNWRAYPPICMILLLLSVSVGWGGIRLYQADNRAEDALEPTSSKTVNIRLIQPNIMQNLKWEMQHYRDNFFKHLMMSEIDHDGFVPDVIIWPESAVPFFLQDDAIARRMIAQVIAKQAILMTGSIRYESDNASPLDDTELGEETLFTSILAVNAEGEIIAQYDKQRLVPFGEFVPLRNVFSFINKITPGEINYTPGPGPITMDFGPHIGKVAPSICYEGVYPGVIVDDNNPPDWMLNVTNDGWFGLTIGPHQHFHMARVRAVEEGIPMVRVANTGISGVIDQYGRIIDQTQLGEERVLDVRLQF